MKFFSISTPSAALRPASDGSESCMRRPTAARRSSSLFPRTGLRPRGACREYTVARMLNKKLFAVVIDPGKSIADLPEYKGTWQAVDVTGGQDGPRAEDPAAGLA